VTDDITNVSQPPLLQIHGTEDTIVPYVDGKKVHERCDDVGLSSDLITIDGAGHVPWDEIMKDQYFTPMVKDMVQGLDLDEAQKPAGCSSEALFMQ
jgi:predicted esterase